MAHLGTPEGAPDAQPRTGPRRLGRVLDRILDAYARVDTGTPADKALHQVFSRARDLGSSERAEVGDVLFGVIRERRRLEDHLRRAAKAERRDFETLDKPIQHRMLVLAWLAEQGSSLADLEATDRFAARRLPKVFERIVKGRLPPAKKRSAIEALAIELSLPTWLAQRLVDAFGEARTRELGQALSVRAPVTLRVDTERLSRDEALARIRAEHEPDAEPTRLSPLGVNLPRAVDLKSWPLFKEGLVDLQDEGSQLIALAARPASPDGARMLDACAGAGGKTLALAALTGGRARLDAIEPDRHKLGELRRRAARVDAKVNTHPIGLEALPDDLHERFDVVLVDAPCTGTGTLRRAPDLAGRLTEADLERDLNRQRVLLTSAFEALKPGGRLVYATCSILEEENEAVVQAALRNEPRLSPLPLAEVWGVELADKLAATHEARIGPGLGGPPRPGQGPDGFYVATMTKA